MTRVGKFSINIRENRTWSCISADMHVQRRDERSCFCTAADGYVHICVKGEWIDLQSISFALNDT